MAQGVGLVLRIQSTAITLRYLLVWILPMIWFLSFPLPLQEILQARGYPRSVAISLPFVIVFGVPVIWSLYFCARMRASFGMTKCQLAFLDEDGSVASPTQSLLRWAIGMIVLPFFILSAIILVIHPKHWSIADWICKVSIGSRPPTTQGFPIWKESN